MTSNGTLKKIERLATELADLLNEHYDFQYNDEPSDLIDELNEIGYAAYMEVESRVRTMED